jgi:hypothetical protein
LWRFEVFSEPDPVLLDNMRFLAGRRRKWLFNANLVARVDEVQARQHLGTASITGTNADAQLPRKAAVPIVLAYAGNPSRRPPE